MNLPPLTVNNYKLTELDDKFFAYTDVIFFKGGGVFL